MRPLYKDFLLACRTIISDKMHEDSFNCEALARELEMSRSQVYKNIKKYTGLSTSAYISTLRIKKAKDLFENTDLSIKEIAYEVGIYDPNYFSRLFRKLEGVSPSGYKQNCEILQ